MFPNLKQLMKDRKVLQSDLSILLNISLKQLNRKINGQNEFTLLEIQKIKNEYFSDIDIEYLFKREM